MQIVKAIHFSGQVFTQVQKVFFAEGFFSDQFSNGCEIVRKCFEVHDLIGFSIGKINILPIKTKNPPAITLKDQRYYDKGRSGYEPVPVVPDELVLCDKIVYYLQGFRYLEHTHRVIIV